MFAPCGSSFGATVICLLTASSTACISSHCGVVVVSNAAVVDPSKVERVASGDEFPVTYPTGVLLIEDVVPVFSAPDGRVAWPESVVLP